MLQTLPSSDVSLLPCGLISAALSSFPFPYLILDSRDHILYASQAACTLLGNSAHQGQSIVSVIRSPVMMDALAQVHNTLKPLQIEYARRVPVPRFFEAQIFPLSPETPSGLLVVLRDLSEERALKRTHADFIAYASHELKTPLAAILGFVETLKTVPCTDEKNHHRFLDMISEQGKRMKALIEDLLMLASFENQTASPLSALRAADSTSSGASLADVVCQTKNLLSHVWSVHGVDILIDIAPDLFVKIPEADLTQVVSNLLENALKYAADGKKIYIRADFPPNQDDFLRLSIQDFGPGIAPEHLPRLAEKFYRIDRGATGIIGGAGLGLTLVEQILARHEGKLLVHSTLGEGSTFSLILPRFVP